MQNESDFRRLVVEVAENGFILTIETENEEKQFVYASARLALTDIRKIMKAAE